MNQKQDNELARKLCADSDRVLADIAFGDNLLRNNPTPDPDPGLLIRIKADMAIAYVQQRQTQARQFVYRVCALAATVIIVVSLTLIIYDRIFYGEQPSVISSAFWDQTQLPSESQIDATFAQLQDSDTLTAITLEPGSRDFSAIADVENELEDLSTSFWEG